MRYQTDPIYKEDVKRRSRERSRIKMREDPEYRKHTMDRLVRLRIIQQTVGTVMFEKARESKRRYERKRSPRLRDELRRQIITAYGGICRCCKENNPVFLTIDHVNGNGAKERRKHSSGRAGINFYKYLKKLGFPQTGYRLLCMNCNWATRYGKECPHAITN